MSRDQRSAARQAGLVTSLTKPDSQYISIFINTHTHKRKEIYKKGKKEAFHNSAGIALHHQLQA